ncbi:LPS export ABC transporter ATP-binding protein [Salinispira pacifica]|uniref:Lipopolysaccharide ABC transporter, ATP-binding protein LptB n=1 Tax=Salinispira pacifica TaxID=1307761 RepID=V5WLX0_9SPIO|nr:LPS export ABC transporter ATP-binding protein [Salinispira pacifica]AHC16638.1 Lipopolysaccharide ABC transporter, ATP-binding protein LptB [Salinispira pacifica]
MSTLQVSNLQKKYGKKQVLRGIDFSMHKGEVVGLLGPNGAGKTTCFYSIVGFIKPNGGDILLNDHVITNLPMYRRARLGISYLPQEASVFRKLSVEDNIWAIIENRNTLSTTEKRDLLESLLGDLGLQEKRKQPAYTLSGGERRRTEIARSLAIDPHFLLLDEPFAGIDPIAVHEIKNIIRILVDKNIGILITDHNVRDTLEITRRSYIIKDGQIVAEGDKAELLKNRLAREVYLGESFEA